MVRERVISTVIRCAMCGHKKWKIREFGSIECMKCGNKIETKKALEKVGQIGSRQLFVFEEQELNK